MREINYRAWLPDESKMIKVHKINFLNRSIEFVDSDICSSGAEEFDILRSCETNSDFPFENCELLRFTGLKDSKGKEIYEGDILSPVKYNTDIPVGSKWEVYYNKEKLTYYRRNYEFKEPLWEIKYVGIQYIIVGNIYENPELLKPDSNV